MQGIDISQAEADDLLAMEKHRVSDDVLFFYALGQKVAINLLSVDRSEAFVLDLTRGRVSLRQVSMQTRARGEIVLARLDLWGPTHRNPDRSVVPTPHLHLYREGFHHRWAKAVPVKSFGQLDSIEKALQGFTRFCNITEPPQIAIREASA